MRARTSFTSSTFVHITVTGTYPNVLLTIYGKTTTPKATLADIKAVFDVNELAQAVMTMSYPDGDGAIIPTDTNAIAYLTGGAAATTINGDGILHGNIGSRQLDLTEKWTQLPDMLTTFTQHGFEAYDGKLYAFMHGDVNTCTAYDIATNDWDYVATLPATGRQSPSLRQIGGKLYLTGGLKSAVDLNDLWEYNPANNTWTQKAYMPTRREDMGSCVVDGNMYVFGGLGTGNVELKIIEKYNPVTNTWTADGNLPDYRLLGDFGCTDADTGKSYIVSSTNTMDNYPAIYPTASVQEVNFITHTFTDLANIPYPVCYKEIEAMNGKLYCIGGADVSSTSPVSYTQIYDIDSNTWSIGDPLPYNAGAGASMTQYDGIIYVSGGLYNNGGEYQAAQDFYSYNPDLVGYTGRWVSDSYVLGHKSGGILFDGSTNYIDTGYTYNQNNLTISLWTKPADGQPSGTQTIVSRSADVNNYLTITLNSSGIIDANCVVGGIEKDTTVYQNTGSVAALSNGAQAGWVMVTAVFEDCSFAGDDHLMIGTTYAGGVDEFYIYNRVLSSGEVAQLYSGRNAFTMSGLKNGNMDYWKRGGKQ